MKKTINHHAPSYFFQHSASPPQSSRIVPHASNNKRRNASSSSARGKSSNATSSPGRHRPPLPSTKKSNKPSMQSVIGDEILMFDPIPASKDALKVVYAYPNTYTVGITSLGYQLVWSFFETHPECSVSRLFTDMATPLPPSPDLIGFSFSWELDYSNLLDLLEYTLRVPLLAVDRREGDPIVFGGGPVLTGNPEPFADFFDVILLGDGEDMLVQFTDKLLEIKRQQHKTSGGGGGGGRREMLVELAATVPGVYVPQLYQPLYAHGDRLGDFEGMEVGHALAPPVVEKQTYRGTQLAASTVVSPRMAWESIYMAEVVRSCPEMCRFCMASYLTLPFRAAPLAASLIPALERGLQVTDRIGLLGASVTQHPEFSDLIQWLMKPERDHVRLSIASVRTNTVTHELCNALAKRGTKSLTIAVESGSERVRRIVNKKLEQEDIVRAVVTAQEGGLRALKLYGMVGVPGEEEEDVEETIDMMLGLKKAAPQLKLTLGCSTFVAKSHTPFQIYGTRPEAEKRLKKLEKALVKEGIQFRPESYKWSVQQAVLSRGDRRLTAALLAAREEENQGGGGGDGGGEDMSVSSMGSLGVFKRAAKQVADRMPPLEHYWRRDYDADAVLPWSHLQGPLPKETLKKHLEDAQQVMAPRE